MSDNGKRIGWAAVMVVAALLVLRDPPPTWVVWMLVFSVSMIRYLYYRDKVRYEREKR